MVEHFVSVSSSRRARSKREQFSWLSSTFVMKYFPALHQVSVKQSVDNPESPTRVLDNPDSRIEDLEPGFVRSALIRAWSIAS